MWLVDQTRPDISNAVRAVARFAHDPKLKHWPEGQWSRADDLRERSLCPQKIRRGSLSRVPP